jgi:hypothetical protein
MTNFEIKSALQNYFLSIKKLKELNLVTNQRDFTTNIGEWLVETIYDGERSKNGIQKYWDINATIGKIQVKSHAKSFNTKARWSAIKNYQNADIDYVVIVVFNENYTLLEFYKIPWKICLNQINLNNTKGVLYWNQIKEYKLDLDSLPKSDIVSLFRQ